MSFGDKAEPRTYINVCVGLGKSPMEIKQLLEKTNRILDGWGRKTAGDRSGPALACLLTLNQAKQCVCRLSYTPVHRQENLAPSCDWISLSFPPSR